MTFSHLTLLREQVRRQHSRANGKSIKPTRQKCDKSGYHIKFVASKLLGRCKERNHETILDFLAQ